ncbi:MAG TPA: hypothetical protein VMH90_03070, partial [Thermoplasmata archaeon]|nr:hypothetical protein [Thermoplasmata archaeon]
MAASRGALRSRGLPAVLAVIAAGLLAGAVPLVWAHSLGSPPALPRPAGAPPQVWTSGDSSSSNSTQSTFNATFSYGSFYADSLTVTASNTSATLVAMRTTLTTVSNSSMQGCARPCTASSEMFHASSSSSTTVTYLENFTANASVRENGTSVPALGLLNASVYLTAEYSEAVQGLALNGSAVTGSLVGSAEGRETFAFASPLGLVPWTVPQDGMWNGSGAYQATSQFQQNYTVTGIFSNLSAWTTTGGGSAPFASQDSPSAYAPSGAPPNASGAIPAPGYGYGFLGGLMGYCPSSNASGDPGTYGSD